MARSYSDVFCQLKVESFAKEEGIELARRNEVARSHSDALLSGKTFCHLKVECFAEEEGIELVRTSKRGASSPPEIVQAKRQNAASSFTKGTVHRNKFPAEGPFRQDD